MMVTDTERREVARRLREAEPGDWYLTISVWGIVQNACGIIDMKTYREKLDRLADLIEPDLRDESFCKVCSHVIPERWDECPRCKSKVVSDD